MNAVAKMNRMRIKQRINATVIARVHSIPKLVANPESIPQSCKETDLFYLYIRYSWPHG